MVSKRERERVLRKAEESRRSRERRARKITSGIRASRPRVDKARASRQRATDRVQQSEAMCVIGAQSNFHHGGRLSESDTKLACGQNSPSLDEAVVIAVEARGDTPSAKKQVAAEKAKAKRTAKKATAKKATAKKSTAKKGSRGKSKDERDEARIAAAEAAMDDGLSDLVDYSGYVVKLARLMEKEDPGLSVVAKGGGVKSIGLKGVDPRTTVVVTADNKTFMELWSGRKGDEKLGVDFVFRYNVARGKEGKQQKARLEAAFEQVRGAFTEKPIRSPYNEWNYLDTFGIEKLDSKIKAWRPSGHSEEGRVFMSVEAGDVVEIHTEKSKPRRMRVYRRFKLSSGKGYRMTVQGLNYKPGDSTAALYYTKGKPMTFDPPALNQDPVKVTKLLASEGKAEPAPKKKLTHAQEFVASLGISTGKIVEFLYGPGHGVPVYSEVMSTRILGEHEVMLKLNKGSLIASAPGSKFEATYSDEKTDPVKARKVTLSKKPSRAAKPTRAFRSFEEPADNEKPPIPMDTVLAGLDVEGKHIAAAIRKMLAIKGARVTTHKSSTSLSVRVLGGGSSFGKEAQSKIDGLFPGKARPGGITVFPYGTFVGDGSPATNVAADKADDFRKAVASAAKIKSPGTVSSADKKTVEKRKKSFPLSKDRAVLVAGMLAELLRQEGLRAKVEARIVNEIVKVTYGSKKGFRGISGIGFTPSGFTFIQGPEENPDNKLAASLFADKLATLIGTRRATVGSTTDYLGLHPDESKKRIGEYESTKDVPTLAVGREDFEERKDARIDRMVERAGKKKAEAAARQKASNDRLPFGGEPIKVGHHSERRHRRDIEKSHNDMRKSIEASRQADSLLRRASSAASNTAISSDDPEALTKLKTKLEALESQRESIKRLNGLARAGKLSDDKNPKTFDGQRMYPTDSYVLSNLGANIRTVKGRIEQLEKRKGRVARRHERLGHEVVENGDLNRLQLHTPGKPSVEARKWLKSHGFRWARSESAWQRNIGDDSWNLGLMYLDKFVEKRDDTPFSSVEAPTPKRKWTDADLAFWKKEFDQLAKDFPAFTGSGDDLEAVSKSLRERKSGYPQLQAVAFGGVTVGGWTMERAMAEMYVYGRVARPKPRRKRALPTSSMSIDQFMEALKAAAPSVGKLNMSARNVYAKSRRDSLYINFYNVPPEVTGGAAAENNRSAFHIEGWERDGSAPKKGKVKMEVSIVPFAFGRSGQLRDKRPRGRSTTPEKMVKVMADILTTMASIETVK